MQGTQTVEDQSKKKTPQYRERDSEKRSAYLFEIEKYPKKQRIYLDESGLCHRLQRTHGYALKGERVHGLTYGKRQGRTNVIGAWSTTHKLFATNTSSAYCEQTGLHRMAQISSSPTSQKAVRPRCGFRS